ncbi:MAG TPA: hypothetical protein VE645_14210, partial [Pseudonocardiaceae bacterium]|nr:hypothetical protein [Pseudonocardiaceae bacterium]
GCQAASVGYFSARRARQLPVHADVTATTDVEQWSGQRDESTALGHSHRVFPPRTTSHEMG